MVAVAAAAVVVVVVVVFLLLMLLMMIILFSIRMQGIYNYIPEANHVSRVYSFAGILCL